jgi:L-fucose isomerase-like protein
MTFNYDNAIAILQAAKEGKEIEARRLGCTMWEPVGVTDYFNFCNYQYRIKPQSVTLYRFLIKDVAHDRYFITERLFRSDEDCQKAYPQMRILRRTAEITVEEDSL